ncbi:hypothetical protein FM107_05890 [Sphingobacterium sp. JB170]|nr:hypothetical protein FM107_05890 [Sphingobacterium sp. JB170]
MEDAFDDLREIESFRVMNIGINQPKYQQGCNESFEKIGN